MKIYLNVPYAEHEMARKRGATWSPAYRAWYIEDKSNLWPFLRWIPQHMKEPHQQQVEPLLKPAKHKRPDGKKCGKQAARKRRQAEYMAFNTAMKEARKLGLIND